MRLQAYIITEEIEVGDIVKIDSGKHKNKKFKVKSSRAGTIKLKTGYDYGITYYLEQVGNTKIGIWEPSTNITKL